MILLWKDFVYTKFFALSYSIDVASNHSYKMNADTCQRVEQVSACFRFGTRKTPESSVESSSHHRSGLAIMGWLLSFIVHQLKWNNHESSVYFISEYVWW